MSQRPGSRKVLRFCVLLFSLLPVWVMGSGQVRSALASSDRRLTTAAAPNSSNPNLDRALPLVFEENAGQMPMGTLFAGRTQQYTVELRSRDLRFHLQSKHGDRMIGLSFTESEGGRAEGLDQASFRTNLYLGNDPAKWRTGVRNYDRVALRALYPGIDAEFYARAQEIEHDFIVAPGADASRLAMHLTGAERVTLTPAGDVVLAAEDGSLRLHRPEAYQILADGRRHAVDAAFELATNEPAASKLGEIRGEGDLRFRLGVYDHERKLVIDPVITYATYVAGEKGSTAAAVAADAAGNVYLTGSTTSTLADFGAENGYGTLTPTGGRTTAFVGELQAADGGSRLAWLTYYGSQATPATLFSVTSTSISLAGGKVYIGGYTGAPDIPLFGTHSFQATAPTGGAVFGFVAAFDAAGGAASEATYVEGTAVSVETTHVNAMTAYTSTTNGAVVTVAGSTTGGSFPNSANAVPVNAALTGALTDTKGFVLTLNADLSSSTYGTYVAGYQTATVSSATIAGVAVDATENIYVAGSTNSDFPKSGPYALANQFPVPTTRCGFLAKLVPASTATTLGFSLSTQGNEVINGLALESAPETTGAHLGLFAFGSTSSATLFSQSAGVKGTSILDTPTAATATYNSLNYIYPATATGVGFAVKVDATTGALLGGTYLGGGASTLSNAVAGAVDATGNLYLTGTTNSQRALFPQQTTGTMTPVNSDVTGLVPLPDGEASTPGTTSGAQVAAGYVARLKSDLSQVLDLAFLGSTVGGSTGVGVALDAKPDAYVLLNDTAANGSQAFTTASATQPKPQFANGTTLSAYVAQVQFGIGAGPAMAADTVGAASSLYYQGTDPGVTMATVSWNLKVLSTGPGASGVVFNLLQSPNLQTYTNAMLMGFTAKVDSVPVASHCTLGPTTVAFLSPGITCVLAGPFQSSTSTDMHVVFSLSTMLSSAVTPGTAFSVPVVTFNAQGDSINLQSQSITASQAAELTLATSVNAPALVNAVGFASQPVPPNSTVTYTYTIKNISTVDSPSTHLIPNLPATFVVSAQAVSYANGAPATPCVAASLIATICDVPGGATLTYTATGAFSGALLDPTGRVAGPFSEPLTAIPSVTYTPIGSATPVYTTASSPSPATVSVQGYAVVSAVISLGGLTYPAATPTGYTLGDVNRTLMVTLTNLGPNQAGKSTVTSVLPKGFVAVSSAATTGTGEANCIAAPFTTCTLDGLTASAAGDGTTNNASTSSGTFTITGYFSDTGTIADAVAPPSPGGGTAASVQASAVASVGISAVVPASTGIILSGNTYGPPSAAVTKPITITRVNNLAYTVSASTTAAAGTAVTINETNKTHLNDQVTYTVELANSGAAPLSVARGLFFTIPVAALSNAASVTLGLPVVTGPGGAYPVLGCSNTTTLITCYTNDLTVTPAATANAPVPGTAASAYKVTFTASYDETSIPATQADGKLPVPQTAGTFFSAATTASQVVYNGIPAMPVNTPTATAAVTVQRATVLTQALMVGRAPGQAVPDSFVDQADINLDEHTAGNLPGKNDTVVFTATSQNGGPNDALGVMVTIPVPAKMIVLTIPASCVLKVGSTTVAVPTDAAFAATGGSMVCTPPTVTTLPVAPSGATYVSQVDSCLGPAPTCPAPYVITFTAKYFDSAIPAETVPGMTATGSETFPLATTLVDTDVDNGNAVLASGSVITAARPSPMTVQRAAHVRLATAKVIPSPTYTDGSVIATVEGVPIVGQAASGMEPLTGTANSQKIYDCIRYSVPVLNDGPNYALGAQMSYALNLGAFAPTQLTNAANNNLKAEPPVQCGTVGTPGPGMNAGSLQTAAFGTLGIPTTGNQGDAFLDGYFDLASLGALNSAAASFSTKSMTGTYNDSKTDGTASNDYIATTTVTLVNTPFNDGNRASFSVVPVGPSIPVAVAFSNVSRPGGITTASISTTAPAGAALPMGTSPYPPDKGKIVALYQPGNTPLYYSAVTTAIVPQSTTGFCVGSVGGVGLPDIFVKPERALLWSLLAAPSGTVFTSIPVFNAGDAPTYLNGDITSNVLSSSANSYTAVGAVTFPQAPQAQPGRVCGLLGGLPTPSQPPLAIAVLEPVNFPPYVTATINSSPQTGKGSTQAQATATLNVGPAGTHDFNDKDPCYLGGTAGKPGTRSSCDDNPYLNAWLYGGGNILGSNQLIGPVAVSQTPVAAQLLAPSFNLGGGAEVYVAVSDQATGADMLNVSVVGADYPAGNPFSHQGNFLTSSALAPVCDPGTLNNGLYIPVTTTCPSPSGSLVSSGDMFYLGAGTGYLSSNVGVQGFIETAASGSGLIALPVTADPLTEAASPIVAASIAAGQTAAFTWPWLSTITHAANSGGANAGTYYTLSCEAVGSSTSGQSPRCNISTVTPTPNTPASASVFYFGTDAASTSSAPSILVITQGALSATNWTPSLRKVGNTIAVAFLLPLFLLRRRLRWITAILTLLISAGSAMLVTGCGSGGVSSSASSATPTGDYSFRVLATPITAPIALANGMTFTPTANQTSGEKVIYSAPFTVSVKTSN